MEAPICIQKYIQEITTYIGKEWNNSQELLFSSIHENINFCLFTLTQNPNIKLNAISRD